MYPNLNAIQTYVMCMSCSKCIQYMNCQPRCLARLQHDANLDRAMVQLTKITDLTAITPAKV